MNDTPSQTIKAAASKTVDVTDARGRVISIGTTTALDKLRLFEIIGPENSANQAYLGYATLASHVRAIDGEPVNRPTGKRELEALVKLLDDEGMNAVGQHFIDMGVQQETEEHAIGAIKN